METGLKLRSRSLLVDRDNNPAVLISLKYLSNSEPAIK